LLLAGIDEAGYGPTLGPLCVGMSLFCIRDWSPGQPAPDLWKLLSTGVCRKPSDRRRRVPIADSKRLKLANDAKSNHPLVHLERGVLACLRSLESSPATDAELMKALDAPVMESPWYGGEPVPIPMALTPGEIAIGAGRIAASLERAGVEILDLRCIIITESALNEVIRTTGSKAEATAMAVGEHIRRVVAAVAARQCSEDRCSDTATESSAEGAEPSAVAVATEPARAMPLRVVCDQLGGRTQYQDILARELPGATVTPLTESGERSRYSIGPESVVQFMPEAEAAHLPVALASMVAKLVRELSMLRFNRYWCSRHPGLKATAGYTQDARRWLQDMRDLLHPDERAAMVRIA
jgi:ribonuclease HII